MKSRDNEEETTISADKNIESEVNERIANRETARSAIRERVKQQISDIKTIDGNAKGNDTTRRTILQSSHFTHALTTTRASLSAADRRRFALIHDQFNGSSSSASSRPLIGTRQIQQ